MFALELQAMGVPEQVLVLAHVAAQRNEGQWFRTADVATLFEAFRIPQPANISQTLSNHREAERVYRRSENPPWSLTPVGQARVNEIFANLDVDDVGEPGVGTGGAEFGEVTHGTLPPELCPLPWAAPIANFLEHHPFERNVFLMTRFPQENGELPDPVQGLIDRARGVLAEHGLELHMASDQKIIDDLWPNVAAHMWACKYGIGLLEDRAGNGLNYNVMTELGAMLVTGRRCALLKDEPIEWIPSDLSGHIYESVDFDDLDAVSAILNDWVTKDLLL